MSDVPLFVWPVGPIINTEPVRYVVNKTDHDRVVDALREQNRVLREALLIMREATYQGHSAHWDPTGGSGSGCPACQRAHELREQAAALTATSQPAKPAGKMHACDIPGCVSCGNPEDATSQEGQG